MAITYSAKARFVFLMLLVSAPAIADNFGVTAVPVGQNLRLDYDGDTNSYYRIYSSSTITGPWQMVEYQLGTQSLQSWVHSGVISASDNLYYRLGRFQNGDPDADGLSDFHELIRARCDRLDRDTDGDQVLDGDEVNVYGTDPVSAFSGPTVFYNFDTNLQGWGAETGAYGSAVLSWTNAGYPRGGAMAVAPSAGTGYGDFYIRDGWLFDNQDVVARPVYGLKLYVPADAPANALQIQLWVKTTADGWLAHYGGFTTATAGLWNAILWDMSSLGTQVLAGVDEWAVKLVWNNRSAWNGAVLVDSIHVLPAAAPSNPPPMITSASPVAGTVARYEKFELNVGLTNIAGLNPYDPDEVDLEAWFVSPSGSTIRSWGFYMEDAGDAYGQGRWKVRFAPGETGTWSYWVRVANAQGTNVSSTSTFQCVTGSRHGWVRVSSDDPHYFEHADRTPFYGIGYCRPYDADDPGIFADAREHGVNMIHYWMAPWDTLLTVKSVAPNRESSEFYRYEQGRAAEVDRVLRYAESNDVKLVFTIWTHDALRDYNYHTWRKNGSWQEAFDWKYEEPEDYVNAFSRLDSPSMNQKFFHDPKHLRYQGHLYRYIIARWGYSESIGLWNLASEMYGTFANSLKCVRWQDPLYVTNKNALVGLDPYQNMDTNQVDGNDYTLPWITYINGFFKTNDPYGHPTTACNETDEYWDDGFAIVDVPQIHAYSESYSWVTPPIMINKYHRHMHDSFDKPSFLGETGSWKWRTYQPDFLRACAWPALCSGAAVTPMMWTVPAFGEYCDPVMGPWLDDMADEAHLFSRFIHDVDFPRLHLQRAEVRAVDSRGEPSPLLIDSFENGISTNWTIFGTGVVSRTSSGIFSSHGTNSLRMNVNMGSWSEMTNAAGGVECYSLSNYNWSSYWPDGVLRVDLYIPEFYHPTNNPDGFLKGINRDPRCVVEIAALGEDSQWKWYSTRVEYADEHQGWKKLTVGMLYNLELRLDQIPTLYQAQNIRGIKIWFGDAGILRGPVYIDNITVGSYNYNTWGMVSSNGEFAFAWIQDRQWTNTLNTYATFGMDGLKNGRFNVEFWNSRRDDINSARNFLVSTGTLYISSSDLPDFARDVSMKIRRIGASGDTVHDISVGCVSQADWIVRSANARVNVTVVNQGTANETCNLYLYDATASQQVSTVSGVSVNAGRSQSASFTWNCSGASPGWHSMIVSSAYVSGEADYADNRFGTEIRLVAAAPPWDPCERMRRWAPRSDITDARSLAVSTNRATEGATSFLFSYAGPTNAGTSAEMWFDNVFESWAGKTQFRVDIYRENEASASNLQFQIWTGTNWTWYYSFTKSLAVGWNSNVTFGLTSNEWGTNGTWWVTPANLDKVQQILFKFTDYTNAGITYLDNMRVQ